jgi:hypothetical protein
MVMNSAWRLRDSLAAQVARSFLKGWCFMATSTTPRADRGNKGGGGPKFHINIEGQTFDWDEDTITAAQVRQLGGLPSSVPVEMIDLETNEQRTLTETEIVTVRPGLGFAKKIKFQRG